MIRVAIIDDWQNVAREAADWSRLADRAELQFFAHPFAGEDDAARQLAPFDVIIPMRERTAFPRGLIVRLGKLRMIAMTGGRSPSLDLAACTERGILVCNTGGTTSSGATAELAIGLMIACMRHIPCADEAMRDGRFQEGVPVGGVLAGRTLGILGLGRIGARVAAVGRALEMKVLAWSPNLTPEKATAGGAAYAAKDELLACSDVISLHVPLSPASRGMLGAAELARMKPGAILINTSRGPLVDEAALIAALDARRLFAGIDVYDEEPLPRDHPLRSVPNTVLTPHIGYGVHESFRTFYGESIENVLAWLDGKPRRVLNTDVLAGLA